ncbi:MAG: hypothetical protein RL398_3444 [Planctomycetota bacterium]|jgi:hypothetical protein
MNHEHGSPQPSSPTPAEIAAAIVFMADDDPRIHAAARDRLLRWGKQAEQALREAAEAESIRTRARARQLLRSLEIRGNLQRVAALRLDAAAPNAAANLLQGAVHLANIVRTFGPDATELGRRLRGEGRTLKAQFEGRSLSACARMLAERLYGVLGLRGITGLGATNASPTRFGVEHVLVDRVLADGPGVPVALSLIYLLVARWAGLSAAGVAMPEHFLIRLHGIRPVLIDPFHGGRLVTKADCTRYLRSRGYDAVQDRLRDIDDRAFLAHYLRALQQGAANAVGHEARRTLGQALALLEAP